MHNHLSSTDLKFLICEKKITESTLTDLTFSISMKLNYLSFIKLKKKS